MPRLPTAAELGNAPSGRSGRPIATYDATAVGRGVQQLGAGIASFGADVASVQSARTTQVDKAQQFETQRRFLEFSAKQDEALITASRNAQPGAFGFRESYQAEYLKSAKEFFATVPDALKGEYDVKLFSVEDQLSGKALTFEREQRKGYYSNAINDGLTKIENDLYANPANFERNLIEGSNYIDALPDDITPIEKDALKREWRKKAQLASLNGMTPQERLTVLGEAPRSSDIIGAMIDVESSGNASATSPKGAIGLMQVMPATGAEIARELGDTAFPASLDQQVEYLKRPDVSRKYGEHYFNKMLARFNGDTEAALIAYNGGAAVAEKWLASGRDDSTIPDESADYYKKVMGRVDSGGGSAAPDPEAAAFLKTRLVGKSADHIDNLRPEMQTRLAQLISAAPPGIREKLGIYSGARSVERQRELWEAALVKYGSPEEARKWVAPPGKSNHNHGSAADLSYDGKSLAQAPADVVAWVHQNAGNYGLKFPLANENWHVEMVETRGGKGFKADPRFADISYVDREKIIAGAQADIARATTEAEAAAKAEYVIRKDAMTLGIETGEVRTEAEILTAPLDDGDKASLLKELRSKNKENVDVRELVGAIVAGDAAASVNPFDADERKTADKAYGAMLKAVPEAQYPVVTDAFVRSTGYIPKDVQAELRLGATATDAATLSGSLDRASALAKAAPASFDAIEGGDGLRKRTEMYRHFVNDLGMTGEEAAQRILKADDPANKVTREVLKTEAGKFVKGLSVGDVTDAFDPGLLSPEPGAGLMPAQANGLLAEYREVAEDAFYQTGGDGEAAKALALSEIKKRWGVSSISGAPQMMRQPPELYYPAIKQKHAYLRDDAMKTAESYVAEMFPGRKVENITLVPTAETRADVEMGRPPRYRLFYQYTEDGQTMFDEVFAGLWGMEKQEVDSMISADRQQTKAAFIERRGLQGAANDMMRSGENEVRRILSEPGNPDVKAAAAEAARYKAQLEATGILTDEAGRRARIDQQERQRQELIEADRKKAGNILRGGIPLTVGN